TEDRLKVMPLRGEPDPRRTIVQTQIARESGQPVPVAFTMRWTDDGWKLFDVIIEGISYVRNYRTDFNSEVQQRGLDALIERLEKGRARKRREWRRTRRDGGSEGRGRSAARQRRSHFRDGCGTRKTVIRLESASQRHRSCRGGRVRQCGTCVAAGMAAPRAPRRHRCRLQERAAAPAAAGTHQRARYLPRLTPLRKFLHLLRNPLRRVLPFPRQECLRSCQSPRTGRRSSP